MERRHFLQSLALPVMGLPVLGALKFNALNDVLDQIASYRGTT